MRPSTNPEHENRFQAIKGDSADQSGIHNLPTVLSVGKYSLISIRTKLDQLEDWGN